MLFIDEASIVVKAGDGGNGCVSFRREKFVPRGGPDGGNGGDGGNIVFLGDKDIHTLIDFRYKRRYAAERGMHGMGSNRYGKKGRDTVIKVPLGTLIKDSNGSIMVDISNDGMTFIAAYGGKGGRGNTSFKSSTHRAPAFAETGMPGEELELKLELKLLADVGIIGYPNAGKSSLIKLVSSAHPKIAPYPFTTLTPNLGVVKIDMDKSFILADIPGLIEDAHKGKGLGIRFLRHIERTKLLLHMVDMSVIDEKRGPLSDFNAINFELESYDKMLLTKPQLIAANKIDIPYARDRIDGFKTVIGDKYEIFPISAVTGEGVDKLLKRLAERLL